MPTHSDPEELALLALGEDVGQDEHVASCKECQAELAALRTVVMTARATDVEADQPTAPRQQVWDGIAAELGLTGAAAQQQGDELARRRASAPAGPTRSWTGPLSLAAAVLVGLVLGVGGTVLLASGDSDGTGGTGGTGGTVVARAALDPLPDRQGTGSAVVRGEGDQRRLVVDVAELTGEGAGYYEVWLLDKDAQRLVSLGILEGSSGQFRLPSTVDVTDFPVVDVSIEPVDGDPAHSGDSVVRGVLES